MNLSFRILSIFLLRSFRLSLRKSRIALGLTLLCILLAGFGIPKLKTLLAMEDLVDDRFVSKQDLSTLKDQFNVRNSMRAVFPRPLGGWTEGELCAVDQWLTSEVIRNPALIGTGSVFDLRYAKYSRGHLLYPLMVPLACGTESAQTNQVLNQSILRASESPWRDTLVGPDGSYLSIALELTDSESPKYGSLDPNSVSLTQKSFEETVTRKFPELRPFWIGAADFQHHLYIGLQRVSILNVLLLLLLVIVLRVAFGTWMSGIVFTGTLVLTGLLLYGFMGLSGAPIDILSKSLFLMVAVAALEDFYFLSCLQQRSRTGWIGNFRKMLVPSFFTSFTSILGFGSLYVSNLDIIRRFGLWAAVGAFLEWVVLFYVLPSICHFVPRLRIWVKPEEKVARRSRLSQWFKGLQRITPPRVLSRIACAIPALALLAGFHLNVQDIPEGVFPESHSLRQGVAYLMGQSGWKTEVSLIFPGGTNSNVVGRVLGEVSKNEAVAQVKNPYDFVDFFNRTISSAKIRELVTSEVKSSRFMESYFGHGSESRAILLLRTSDTRSTTALEKEVSRICAPYGCYLAGPPVLYAKFSRLVPQTLIESLGLSLVLVSLVLFWLAKAGGNLKVLPKILISAFWGTAVMFLLIAVLQIRINFLTCIFASVLVGLTGDNAIQYLFSSRRRPLLTGIREKADASILCGLTMALASMVFLGSYFVPPRVFGVLLAGGFLASLVGDFWLLKGLLE